MNPHGRRCLSLSLSLLALAALSPARAQEAGTITTVAGNGQQGFSGDGGPATAARLNQAVDVASDGSGNLYIADRANHRIRKIDANGIITTIAGSGPIGESNGGFGGDGGPATKARLHTPEAVALDQSGNLYIADMYNERVRKVDRDGIITTVVGGGTGDPKAGGAATDVKLLQPCDVALDGSGHLYLLDGCNGGSPVYRVSPEGTISVLVMGEYSTFSEPPTDGSPVDAGGPARVPMYQPESIIVDRQGNLYLSDSARITKVSPSGTVSIVAGGKFDFDRGYYGDGGPATQANMWNTGGVTFDADGNLYFSDFEYGRVRKVDPSGIIHRVAGNGISRFSGDGGSALNASFRTPVGLTIDARGDLYIVDMWNHRVRKVSGVSPGGGTLAGVPMRGVIAYQDGDLNGDGVTDLRDVQLSLGFAVGSRTPERTHLIQGDMNGDARITLADTIVLLMKVLGIDP